MDFSFKGPRARRFVPYAERLAYAGHGRHHASARRSPGKWAVSLLREMGDALFGAFAIA